MSYDKKKQLAAVVCKLKLSNKILCLGCRLASKSFVLLVLHPVLLGGERSGKFALFTWILKYVVPRTRYQVFIDFPIRECNHVAAAAVFVDTRVGCGKMVAKKLPYVDEKRVVKSVGG